MIELFKSLRTSRTDRFSASSIHAIRLGAWVMFFSVAGLYATGCAAAVGGVMMAMEEEKQIVRMDPRVSFNVAEVPSWFPGEDAPLTDTEKIVHLTRGKPDYIRFWWDDSGSFIRSSDFSGHMGEVSDMVKEVDRSWIYMDEGVDVRFPSEGGYKEEYLDDMTRAVCEFGDPTSKKTPKITKDGELKEYWLWSDRGVKIDFVDRKEVRRGYFAGTGKGTNLTR